MRLEVRFICDILVNQYEHMNSLEELAASIVGEERAEEGLVRAATELAHLWAESQYIRYATNPNLVEAENDLREFVTKYLGSFL